MPWAQVLELLVVNRLIEPGSEFRLHRHWFDHSAMDVLLGRDFAAAEKDRLYRCLDRVLEHKPDLLVHLQQRWKDLFHAEFDLLLRSDEYLYGRGSGEQSEGALWLQPRWPGQQPSRGRQRSRALDNIDSETTGRGASSPVEDASGVVPWTTSTRRLTDGGPAAPEAGRAFGFVRINLPQARQEVTRETFTFRLDKAKLKEAELRDGHYLLRTNLVAEDPAVLWDRYVLLTQIEAAFKCLKSDLGIRPIYHQLEHRVEAHIMVAFLAYCLSVPLKQKLRGHAPGLTPRAVLEKLAAILWTSLFPPRMAGFWLCRAIPSRNLSRQSCYISSVSYSGPQGSALFPNSKCSGDLWDASVENKGTPGLRCSQLRKLG